MGAQGWPSRVWMTLHEPRWVTAAMVGVYGALVKMTVTILSSPGGTPLDVVLGCLLLAVGGGIGILSAWRGAFWAEGPALLLCALGLSAITVVDVLRPNPVTWAGWPTDLAVAMILFLLVRAASIWPLMWAPGRQPDDDLRKAECKALVATVALDAALRTDD